MVGWRSGERGIADDPGSKVNSDTMNSLSAFSKTIRILHTSLFNFFCYLSIGVLLTTLPSFVHLQLGLSPIWAGVAVSLQYLATLISRPWAGRMTDVRGSRATVLLGQAAGLLSGLFILGAGALQHESATACFAVLLASRLILGCGESCVATGSTTWGLGRVAPEDAALVISWSGIASYGAMALGAPISIWLHVHYGISGIGATVSGIFVLSFALSLWLGDVPLLRGAPLPFTQLLRRVFLHGVGLAFGTIGFALIAAFTTLYYAHQAWDHPSYALILFGSSFVLARLLFNGSITRWGGLMVAAVSLAIESTGLAILWLAPTPDLALLGAALSGAGFALVFPALGVEAVRTVRPQDRGSALGVYTAFLDLAMGITGPTAGYVIGIFGYSAIFLLGSVTAICGLLSCLFLFRLYGDAVDHARDNSKDDLAREPLRKVTKLKRITS